jgi:hypothetical protein
MQTFHHSFSSIFTPLLCCLLCCTLISACGSSSVSSPASEQHASSQGQKLASSMADYIQQTIKQPNTPRKQVAVLKKALKNNNKISPADYNAAWSGYTQCMVDRGYKNPEYSSYRGFRDLPQTDENGLSKAQDEKLSKDLSFCYADNVFAINVIWKAQIGNPDLLTDTNESIVDCLHRHHVAPKSYTTSDYTRDSEKFSNSAAQTNPFPYDYTTNPWARSCEVANGKGVGLVDDHYWKVIDSLR